MIKLFLLRIYCFFKNKGKHDWVMGGDYNMCWTCKKIVEAKLTE